MTTKEAADNPEFDAKEELDKARRELDNLKADFESLEHDAAQVVRALDELPVDLRAAVEALRDNGRDGWWGRKARGDGR
jgi:hypothetical protein